MTPKLYKAADVCEIAQLQPFVLRSWEKEFPGIGIQKDDGPRLYRQSDLDQLLRIKQLVFVDGLTLAGARRKIEESQPAPAGKAAQSEVIEILGADVHKRITHVRNGLRSILHLLDGRQDGYQLTPPPPAAPPRKAPSPAGKNIAARTTPASTRKTVVTRGKAAPKRVSRAR